MRSLKLTPATGDRMPITPTAVGVPAVSIPRHCTYYYTQTATYTLSYVKTDYTNIFITKKQSHSAPAARACSCMHVPYIFWQERYLGQHFKHCGTHWGYYWNRWRRRIELKLSLFVFVIYIIPRYLRLTKSGLSSELSSLQVTHAWIICCIPCLYFLVCLY